MTDAKLILIVDDEQLNVELLLDVLASKGYRTITACNGLEALECYTAIKPDLVLLDVMMPDLDGYTTCLRLRDLEKDVDSTTPVIFLSSKANLDDKLKGYAAGGDDYVTKPFDNAELLVKIESALQRYQLMKVLQENASQAQSMTLMIMTNAAKIGIIGRFLQDSLACRDVEQLIDCFFEMVNQFELACTLKICWRNKVMTRSYDGVERALDKEILSNCAGQDKIFHFGKNRALFNWNEVALLVRNVGDEADNIAIMMDGLLAGYRAIATHDLLLNAVDDFGMRNRQLAAQSAKTVDDLNDELRVLFNEFGSGTTLNEHEELAIAAVVDHHRQHLDHIALESLRLEEQLGLALQMFKGSAN